MMPPNSQRSVQAKGTRATLGDGEALAGSGGRAGAYRRRPPVSCERSTETFHMFGADPSGEFAFEFFDYLAGRVGELIASAR